MICNNNLFNFISQAHREKLFKLKAASVIDEANQDNSRTFNNRILGCYLYKTSYAGQIHYQVEDCMGKKSREFTINESDTVVVNMEFFSRSGTVVAILTFHGAEAFTFYQNHVSPLEGFTVSINIHQIIRIIPVILNKMS